VIRGGEITKFVLKLNAALVLIYFIAVSFILTVKQGVLEDGGYRIMARLVGRDDATSDILWQLSFFAADIWLLLIVVPLMLAIVFQLAGEKVGARTILILALAFIGLAFVDLNALGSMGKFLTMDQIPPMFEWVKERPSSVFEYVSPRALAKLAVIVTAVLALYRYRRSRIFLYFHAALPLAILFGVTVSIVAAYAVSTDSTPRTPYHAPVAATMLTEMFVSTSRQVAAGGGRLGAERIDYTCGAELPAKGLRAASRPNVVLFVMETVPYELYVFGKERGLPNMQALERSALVSQQHYTTYPFTSYARFSILTGLYPSYRLEKTLKLDRSHRYRTAVSSLVGHGYDFKVFDPVRHRYPVDDWLVKQLGGEVVSTDRDGDPLTKDKIVLSEMVAKIELSASERKPFVYAYLPQLTHGPWLAPGASKQDLYAEGYRRLKHVDDSLGELITALEKNGVRDNTIIVLTADHGLRTRAEAGFLKTAVLNEASYHVPLVINDPGLKRSIELRGPSSHVDVSPSLHCAYGAAGEHINSQGAELLAPVSSKRSIRFGGEWYNGSGGLWSGGIFYSYNAQLNMLWKSRSFEFDEAGPVQEKGRDLEVLNGLVQSNQSQEQLLGEQIDTLSMKPETARR
jgi:hypothetical protein